MDGYEEGWVIEHCGSEVFAPVYMGIHDGQIIWSADNLSAFRMSRKVDAEAFRDAFFGGGHRVASHGWGP